MAHGEALRIRVIKAVVEDGLSRNEAAIPGRDRERDPLGEGVRGNAAHGGFADWRGPALCAEAASGLAPGTSA